MANGSKHFSGCHSASTESAQFHTKISLVTTMEEQVSATVGYRPGLHKVQLVDDNFKGIPSGISGQELSPGTSLLRPSGIHFFDSPPEFSPGPQRKGSNNFSLATTVPKVKSPDSSVELSNSFLLGYKSVS